MCDDVERRAGMPSADAFGVRRAMGFAARPGQSSNALTERSDGRG